MPTGTLKDLADRSGISAATLSRVLNHPDQVRPELRARAEAVLAQAGYVPHGAARSLALRRTRTMGAVVPTVDSALFARIVEGLQQKLHGQGYQLLLASSAYVPAREAVEVRALVERGVDGMMLVGTQRGAGVVEMLRARRIPFVTTCHHDPDASWPTLGWDNVLAAERVADYLLDMGHRRFGIVVGITRDNDRAADRLVGFRRALARRGVDIPAANVIERPYTVADARGAMAMLLRRAEPPTAVLCGNDILAYGALQECLWRDIPVPEQVSITGFDDIEMAAHCKPGMTTLHVPALEIGQQAGARLLAAATSDEPLEPDHLVCELELIVRGTTGLPPASGTAAPSSRKRQPARSAASAPAPAEAPRPRPGARRRTTP